MSITNDSLTVTHQQAGRSALATVDVVVGGQGGPTSAYCELRIDGQSSFLKMDNFCVGVLKEQGLEHDTDPGSSWNELCKDAWVLKLSNGALCGNGKSHSDQQGDGSIAVGDRIGVLVDVEGGEGRVLFFKNGQQYGPGYQEGVSSPWRRCDTKTSNARLVVAVKMQYQGQQCTLLPDATRPSEPFAKWA
jgi:hypothetical protein